MPDKPRDDLINILETVTKAQLNALRRLRRSPPQKPAGNAREAGKRMSHIQIVHDILHRAGHPLHITEILALVAKRHGIQLDRESIVSALAKRVARQDRFIRTAPNTFGLLPEIER
jgi:hypothetical protein